MRIMINLFLTLKVVNLIEIRLVPCLSRNSYKKAKKQRDVLIKVT